MRLEYVTGIFTDVYAKGVELHERYNGDIPADVIKKELFGATFDKFIGVKDLEDRAISIIGIKPSALL